MLSFLLRPRVLVVLGLVAAGVVAFAVAAARSGSPGCTVGTPEVNLPPTDHAANVRKAERLVAQMPTAIAYHERIAKGLDPVQEAFIEAGAFQCGFCTSGFILMVKQLLDAIPDPSDEDIRHYLAGNLCRCSAYPEILDAVRIAAKRRAEAAHA